MMCRSQTFDGAGNISGKTKRAVARFCLKTKSEKALYFHCASHELNLCLPKVPQVSNMLSFFFFFFIYDKSNAVSYFINFLQDIKES